MDDVTALIAAVAECPGETTPVRCLADAYQEAGVSPLAATRRANKVARASVAAAQLAAAKVLVTGDTAEAIGMRRRIRHAVGLSNTVAPITVVEGASAPVAAGEAAHHTFRDDGGGVCGYPGAAIRAGYRLDYHTSTLRITVGAVWVLA